MIGQPSEPFKVDRLTLEGFQFLRKDNFNARLASNRKIFGVTRINSRHRITSFKIECLVALGLPTMISMTTLLRTITSLDFLKQRWISTMLN